MELFHVKNKVFTVLDNNKAGKDTLDSYKIVKSRIDHSAVMWTSGERIVIYGGQDHNQVKIAKGPEEESKLNIKPIRNCIKDICMFNLHSR